MNKFNDFLNIEEEFAKLLFRLVSTSPLGISQHDLNHGLNALFDIYWLPPRSQSPIAVPVSPGARLTRRSLSFSKHYRHDRRSMLCYIYAAAMLSASKEQYENQKFILNNEVEWELYDDIILKKKDVSVLVSTIYNLVISDMSSDQSRTDNMKIVGFIFGEKKEFSFRDLYEWFDRNNPQFFNPLDFRIYSKFALGSSAEAYKFYRGPLLIVPKVDKSNFLQLEEIWMIASALPTEYLHRHYNGSKKDFFQPHWKMLYNSDDQGHSVAQFEYHCFDYDAPTILFVHAETKERETLVIGAFVASAWKSRKGFWGENECFLFELCPNFEILHAKTEGSTNYVHFNVSDGWGFGGTLKDGFVLSIDPTMSKCKFAPSIGQTYRASQYRLIDVSLDVIRIEVYGIGGDAAFERWEKEKQWNEDNAEKRKELKLRSDDAEVDQMMLGLMGVHEFHHESRLPDPDIDK